MTGIEDIDTSFTLSKLATRLSWVLNFDPKEVEGFRNHDCEKCGMGCFRQATCWEIDLPEEGWKEVLKLKIKEYK